MPTVADRHQLQSQSIAVCMKNGLSQTLFTISIVVFFHTFHTLTNVIFVYCKANADQSNKEYL